MVDGYSYVQIFPFEGSHYSVAPANHTCNAGWVDSCHDLSSFGTATPTLTNSYGGGGATSGGQLTLMDTQNGGIGGLILKSFDGTSYHNGYIGASYGSGGIVMEAPRNFSGQGYKFYNNGRAIDILQLDSVTGAGTFYGPVNAPSFLSSASQTIASTYLNAQFRVVNTLNSAGGHAVFSMQRTSQNASAAACYGTGSTAEWCAGETGNATVADSNYSIRDSVTGNTPFVLAQNEPTYSQYMDSGGNVNLKNNLNVYENINLAQLTGVGIGTITTSTTGGTLAASTQYCYKIAAYNSTGSTASSSESCITTGSTTSTNTVTIGVNPISTTNNCMATGYYVYGRTTGAEQYIATAASTCPALATYTDTGAITPSGLPPTINTTGGSFSGSGVGLTDIPDSALATQAANTVLGALTATTPSPLAVPSCSGAANALTWTSGTGFGCNTISSGGSGTVNGGTIYSPAYYAATGTAVSGVTPFTGLAWYSTSAAPEAATAANIESAFGSQTANKFLASPNGSAGTSTFRAIVAADITALPNQVHPLAFADMSGTAYTASQIVARYLIPVAQTIPAGGSVTTLGVACTSEATLSTAATASTTFSIDDNGTSFGTIAFAASGTSGTFTISSAKVFSIGNVITFVGPSTADSTAAGLAVSLCSMY